jgi:hypothetical protein
MGAAEYRSLDSLTDSEEDFHPNIDTKSYRKFIKEERKRRLEYLKSKKSLSEDEIKELKILEYKELPVVVEVPEESFRVSKDIEEQNSDESDRYVNFLMELINNNTVEYFIDFLDTKFLDLNELEDLAYLNLSEAIKNDNDDIGFEFCKIGLLIKWSKDFGRSYLMKLKNKEEKVNDIVSEHYEVSKKAILSIRKEN